MSNPRFLAALALVVSTSGCARESPAPPRAVPASAAVDARPAAAEIVAVHLTGDGPRTLAEARGQVVVLHFWASYIDPSRRSLARYQALQAGYPGQVAVIGIGIDEPGPGVEAALTDFATDVDVRFPLVWDRSGKTKAAYRPRHLPSTYVIDQEGELRFVHARDEAGTDDMVALQVESLLSR
ncbi:MAG: TlpA family protein disulfide reductase [Myxococcales bacterium]|nr:TlpA family protein disulfide reductase [Myxococcales bacterium]